MLQRLLGLTLLLLLLLLLLASLFAAAVTTTGTGVSAAIARASSSHGLPTVITTALDASPSERHAASDLAATLNNISGAARAFRVVAATRQRAITTPQIAVGFGAATVLGVPAADLKGLGLEGFVARTFTGTSYAPAGSVALSGGFGAPRGVLYAVNDFLQALGVHRLAQDTTVLPAALPVALPPLRQTAFIPKLEYRQQYEFATNQPTQPAVDLAVQGLGLNAVSVQGHGGNIGVQACRSLAPAPNCSALDDAHGGGVLFAPNPGLTHTSLILVPPTIYNETHPEWYAAPEFGWPHGNQLCWKAPGLQEFLAQRVATLLRAQPNVSIISVSQSDDKVVKNSSSPVGYTIHSGECRTGQDLIETVKEGSPMAPMLQTVNFIADAIAKEFPHVAVNTLAYSYARLAPNITRPRSNVIVQLATGDCNFGAAMTDVSNAPFRLYMESWAKRSNRTWIWNYQTNFHSFITPFPDYFMLGSHIRYFVENNVTGIFQQGASSGPGADMAELRDYVTARMMFEPTLDSTQLIVRFVAGYYGPAAAPHVMTYLHTMDAAVTNTSFDLKVGFDGIHAAFLTPEVLLHAAAVWTAAKQAAATNPLFSAHVKRSALSVWYVVVHRWAELTQYAKAHRIAWPLEATLEGAFATLANAVELTNAAYREGAPCVIEGPPWSNSCGQVMVDAFSSPLNVTALHDELFPDRRPATAIRVLPDRAHIEGVQDDLIRGVCGVGSHYVIVSPRGSDDDNGTLARPFASLERARLELRRLSPDTDACVLLRAGHHVRNSTFELTPEDGGSKRIVYSSYPGERAIIEGGQVLTGWASTKNGVWSAPLPLSMRGFVPRQAWIGEDRVNETGLVGTNMTFGDGTVLNKSNTVMTTTGYLTSHSGMVAAAIAHDAACVATPPDVSCASDVEFVYRRVRVQWTEDRLRVESWKLLPNGWLNITFPAAGWKLRVIDIDVNVCQRNPNRTSTCRDFPTSIINLHSTLQKPGTGYISGASQRVYYLPRPGDQLASNASVYVSSFNGPLLILKGERHGHANGSVSKPPRFVENLEFTGLTLQHASWSHSPSCGYLADQGGFVYDCDMSYCCTSGLVGQVFPVGSALEIRTARNVTITNVVIRNVGCGGLAVDEGSDGVTITDSLFYDLSCWGVRLGQVNDSIASADWDMRRTQNLVLNNSVVYDSGAELRGCPAIMGGFVRSSNITHNTVTHAQWGGITLGWGWGTVKANVLGRNRITGNRVTHTNLATSDGGTIYTLGANLAGQSTMSHNFVAHASHKSCYLYHDEGSSNWHTHDNVVDSPASDLPAICRGSFVCDEMPGHFDYLGAWAESERDILVERCTTRGLNQSNVYNLTVQAGVTVTNGNNITVTSQVFLGDGEPWPAAAQRIVDSAGASLKWHEVGSASGAFKTDDLSSFGGNRSAGGHIAPDRRLATAIREDLVGSNDKAGGHREAPHLRIFSFYGDDPAGQQGIVNVRLNNGNFPGKVGHFNFSSIDASFAKNMSNFIDIGGYNNMVWQQGRSGVLPGWQDRITSTLVAASTRIASGAVAGLFLGDEIVCGGMPVENLTAVAAFCKKKLMQMGHTKALVYLNECSGSFIANSPNRRPNDYFKDSIPAGLDIISYDSYQLSNNTKFAPTPWWLQEPIGNRLFYKTHILPKLRPHQKFMVVPGFYGNDSATADEQTLQDGRLLAKLEQYWTWMKEDPKVVGIVPYHWDNTNACLLKNTSACPHMCYGNVCGLDGELFGWGAKNYPRLVARMKEIGAIIAGNNAVGA